MDRLTKWLDNRKALCIEVCEKECTEGYYECHDCKPFTDVMKKLAEYEDLEEQGLLLKLKYGVGDKIYHRNYAGKIEEERISMVTQKSDKTMKYRISGRYGCHDVNEVYINSIYYHTKEEAEKALAEMEK